MFKKSIAFVMLWAFLFSNATFAFGDIAIRFDALRVKAFSERKGEHPKSKGARRKKTNNVISEEGPMAQGVVNIEEYLTELQNDYSIHCWELRELYGDEWKIRRERLITVLTHYRELYPKVKYVVIARAPGRITANEHTDYNDALSLGMPAIQDNIAIVGLNPDGSRLVLNNMEPDKFPSPKKTFDVAEVPSIKIQPGKSKAEIPWTTFSIALYQGLIKRFQNYGVEKIPGMCILVDGRDQLGGVPVESNISSSAAFEEAQVYAIEALLGLTGMMTAGEVIEVGREAEAKLGFPCGKLDQGSSTAGRVVVLPGQRVGAAIDCVPRLDTQGRDKTIIKPFVMPAGLEAILVDTGPKGDATREYNIRVIEGELGSWILAKKLDELSKEFGLHAGQVRQKIQELYGDINRDHNGKPYLYDPNRLYPVFLKPYFFASIVLNELGVEVSAKEVEVWVKKNLPTHVTKQKLVQDYGPVFLDFYVKSAMPFHYALARDKLKEEGITEDRVDEETLSRWIKALLRDQLYSVEEEMGLYGLDPQLLAPLQVSSYNLQGTVLHAIGEQNRSKAIIEVLHDAATKIGKEKEAALRRFGELEREGYESLRDNYRNSTKNIDTIAEWAGKQRWCLATGACRHFGAGWGGWMEIWIKPGMRDKAEKALSKFLGHSRMKPYKPGAPASIMGQYGFSLQRYEKPRFAFMDLEHLTTNKRRLINIVEAARRRRGEIIEAVRREPKRKQEILAEAITAAEEISPHVKALVADPAKACWGVNFGPAGYYELYSFLWNLNLESAEGIPQGDICHRWDILQRICDHALWNATGINPTSEEGAYLRKLCLFVDDVYDDNMPKTKDAVQAVYSEKRNFMEQLAKSPPAQLQQPRIRQAFMQYFTTLLSINMDLYEFGQRVRSEGYNFGAGDEHEFGSKYEGNTAYVYFFLLTKDSAYDEKSEQLGAWALFLAWVSEAYRNLTELQRFDEKSIRQIAEDYKKILSDEELKSVPPEVRRKRIAYELDILARDPRFKERVLAVIEGLGRLGIKLPIVSGQAGMAPGATPPAKDFAAALSAI